MLQPQSLVQIVDNTGAKLGRVFKVLGGSKRRYAEIGDVVVLSVISAEPRKARKKKDVVKGVIVRQTKAFRRADGSYIRFDDNAVVLVTKKKREYETEGNRVFGPMPRELSENGFKCVTKLAPEIV
jgi:large subunit ribosomal protein L14